MNIQAKRIPDPGNKLISILLMTTIIASSLILYRHEITGNKTYLFLLWNLFLAWIPLIISTSLRAFTAKKRNGLLLLIPAALWLLFFPNTPYIITDLVHLKPRNDIAYWYDFLILIFCCFNSLFIAFASLIQMKRIIHKYLPNCISHITIISILVLTSFGIYLGRFERYNSWDLVVQPVNLFTDIYSLIINAGQNHQMVYVVGILAVFLILNYFTLLFIVNDASHVNQSAQKEK